MKALGWTAALTLMLAPWQATDGAILFTSGLEDGANWTVVADDDTEIDFGFDYSSMGIPPAPGAEDTIGLRMAANILDPGAAAGISASPNGVTASGQYRVKFDFWINYTAPGTTEFAGTFVGFDPTHNNPRNGAGLLADSDGDSGSDYRLYEGVDESTVNQVGAFNNDEFAGQLSGGSTPALQLDASVFNPPNDDLTAPDGALGFAWHTMTVDVDSAAGSASFAIDGVDIGVVTTDLNLEGRVALTYMDLFSSVAGDSRFAFGLFDNFEINVVPEPTSLTLASLAGLLLAAAARGRR